MLAPTVDYAGDMTERGREDDIKMDLIKSEETQTRPLAWIWETFVLCSSPLAVSYSKCSFNPCDNCSTSIFPVSAVDFDLKHNEHACPLAHVMRP